MTKTIKFANISAYVISNFFAYAITSVPIITQMAIIETKLI